jgi:hypothetical protein
MAMPSAFQALNALPTGLSRAAGMKFSHVDRQIPDASQASIDPPNITID